MVVQKIPSGLDLTNNTWNVPCGIYHLSVAPASETDTFDVLYLDGSSNMGIKQSFTLSGMIAMKTREGTHQMKIVANGTVHISFMK